MQDLYPSRLEDENIINRVDPVVYSKKMITEHSLNKEQLDSYERNGFIVFPKLFSKDEIKAFKEELKSLESNIELRKKDEFISEPDSNELRTIFNQHLYSKLFDKLSKDGEFEILSKFDKNDLKGSYDIRNYIVHDYEGLNLMIIEVVIREKLPKIKDVVLELLK